MTLALPWMPTGAVYGTLLNTRREAALWAPKMSQAPYQAAPTAPVLYVKTANTLAASGAAVAVPQPVWLGPTLGLVMGELVSNGPSAIAACAQPAPEIVVAGGMTIAGCVLLNDLSLPHESYYRPAMRCRNRDGFLVCGTPVAALAPAQIAALQIEARVNGRWVQTLDLSTLVRGAAALLAEVSAFMTLQPGDVLMLGTDCQPDGSRPLAKAGDRVEISAPGFAPLVHTLRAEEAP